MIRILIVAALVLGPSIAVSAADEALIETRQNIMDSMREATRAAGNMVRGETEFDAVLAELAMRTIFTAAAGVPGYFPEGTETGGDTEALPAIWENKEDFEERFAAMQADAWAAVEPAKQDLETFTPAFQAVATHCGDCHELYRLDR